MPVQKDREVPSGGVVVVFGCGLLSSAGFAIELCSIPWESGARCRLVVFDRIGVSYRSRGLCSLGWALALLACTSLVAGWSCSRPQRIRLRFFGNVRPRSTPETPEVRVHGPTSHVCGRSTPTFHVCEALDGRDVESNTVHV